jgi:hypothetical protein
MGGRISGKMINHEGTQAKYFGILDEANNTNADTNETGIINIIHTVTSAPE